MNLLRRPGSIVYGLVNLGAFLGGLLISLDLLPGFAGNARWTTNQHPGWSASYIARIDGGVFFLGTVILFLGLLGVFSSRRVFPIFSLIGVTFSLLVSVPYVAGGNSQTWSLASVFCEFVVLILSLIKLKQIRKLR